MAKIKATEEFLIEEYTNKKQSTGVVGRLIGRSHFYIRTQLIKFGIPTRTISEALTGRKCPGVYAAVKGKTGPLSRNWQGGKTPIGFMIRNLQENRDWQIKVFNRDNKLCVKCGGTDRLQAHHKKQFSIILAAFLQKYSRFSPIDDKCTLVKLAMDYADFWDVDNGETLCYGCHEEIPVEQRRSNQWL